METLEDGRDSVSSGRERRVLLSSGGVGWKDGMLAGVGVWISMPVGCRCSRIEAVMSACGSRNAFNAFLCCLD